MSYGDGMGSVAMSQLHGLWFDSELGLQSMQSPHSVWFPPISQNHAGS